VKRFCLQNGCISYAGNGSVSLFGIFYIFADRKGGGAKKK